MQCMRLNHNNARSLFSLYTPLAYSHYVKGHQGNGEMLGFVLVFDVLSWCV